jgi:hypothetical protein
VIRYLLEHMEYGTLLSSPYNYLLDIAVQPLSRDKTSPYVIVLVIIRKKRRQIRKSFKLISVQKFSLDQSWPSKALKRQSNEQFNEALNASLSQFLVSVERFFTSLLKFAIISYN